MTIKWISLWNRIKDLSENAGLLILILGALALLAVLVLWLMRIIKLDTGLIGAILGIISVGLGFIAIGMAAKLDRDVANLPGNIAKDDTLTLTVEQVLRKVLTKQVELQHADVGFRFTITDEQSKANAQARLDEDTKKAGHIRGELFQLPNGGWAIHWNP
jgi:hypothetical protein